MDTCGTRRSDTAEAHQIPLTSPVGGHRGRHRGCGAAVGSFALDGTAIRLVASTRQERERAEQDPVEDSRGAHAGHAAYRADVCSEVPVQVSAFEASSARSDDG